jgi:hypothetical protein
MLPLLLAASLGAQIAERADRFVGRRSPASRDDCSGFVTAIHGQEGIDLRAPERPGENGVTNIRRRAGRRTPCDAIRVRATWSSSATPTARD